MGNTSNTMSKKVNAFHLRGTKRTPDRGPTRPSRFSVRSPRGTAPKVRSPSGNAPKGRRRCGISMDRAPLLMILLEKGRGKLDRGQEFPRDAPTATRNLGCTTLTNRELCETQ